MIKLSFAQQILVSGFCWLLVFAGFVIPFVLLILMAVENSNMTQFMALLTPSLNSIEVSFYAASIATGLALLFGLYRRLSADKWRILPLNLAGFGYAVPGTVLAMVLLSTFGPLDGYINDIANYFELSSPGLVLSGTIFAVVFAFVVRFAAIANGTCLLYTSPSPRDS